MKISLRWLGDYVSFVEKDPYRIAEVLTLNTAEIDKVVPHEFDFQNIVIGRIEEIAPHPQADRLKVCRVYDGENTLPIFCGGSNLYPQMLVALAKPGAKVSWMGKEEITVEKTTIRGAESFGMLCGADEIGLEKYFMSPDEKALLDLTEYNFTPGQPLSEALDLNDIVFEIENPALTHRPDLFSHQGFARECVAHGLAKWKNKKALELPVVRRKTFPFQVKIEHPELCPRYMGVVIDNVSVKQSPLWLKQRLGACGIRSINSLVDITNLIMLDTGIPTHAFDLRQIHGEKIVMRESKEGEEVTTLDGAKRKLPAEVIILEDQKGIFDLCGIMGGDRSAVQQDTKTIFFHAPIFEKVRIRRAALSIGHRTDASTIFEKGVPHIAAEEAMKLFIHLIQEVYPQAVIDSHILDIFSKPEKNRIIQIEKSLIDRVLGVEVKPNFLEKRLEDLGFSVRRDHRKKQEVYSFEVPAHRYSDIHLPEDIIEEIVRVYGVNNIPSSVPALPMEAVNLPAEKALLRKIRRSLSAVGFSEAFNYSFLGKALLQKCSLNVDQNSLRLKNPLTEDLEYMRESILPWLLVNTQDNKRYTNDVLLYEIGKVFSLQNKAPAEQLQIAGIFASRSYDFFKLKGIVEQLFQDLGIAAAFVFDNSPAPYMHPGRSARIEVGEKKIGQIFELHPAVLYQFDEKNPAGGFELNFASLLSLAQETRTYRSLPKFPSVTLDINLLIGKKTAAETYLTVMKNIDQNLIQSVEIIDEYQGEKIPADKRSVTYRLVYNAPDHTLTEEEVQNIHQVVMREVEQKGAKIRDF